jgi:endonuclease/exonuclease/phosphatase family metal-dependent hydrolase
VIYTARHGEPPPARTDTLLVMCWNIRFGAGRAPWFGDGCGDRVVIPDDEVLDNLDKIARTVNQIKPDILLLQEVDVRSKRSGYIDEMQWLLDHTRFKYGAYASMWDVRYVPKKWLGRINTGQAVLSRWKIGEAERIRLPLRGDQDALTRFFYLRRCILKVRIAIPGADNFYVLNTHIDAFSTDATKKKQIDRFKNELDSLGRSGAVFVAGGDFNLIPPRSDSTDFCFEDRCPGQSFHGPNDHPRHKEGSFFTPEAAWLLDLYEAYPPSVPLKKYVHNQVHYFTSTPKPDSFWDRKIDHLFTNTRWAAGSDSTYQNMTTLSDHVPISARWPVPKKESE